MDGHDGAFAERVGIARPHTFVGRRVGDGSPDRLRRLVEVGIALSSELGLEALLQSLIDTAAEMTGARYGALGVIDRAGTGLEQFITVGIDADTRATIGDLPLGRGVLGVLIRDRQPLRLRELGLDPRSVGFPPGHPPMGSFLGVPIMLRGTAFGNLYLTEKAGGGEFSDEDEEIVRLLAAQAGVAIENARLYESSRRWSLQLEALNEVSEALVGEIGLAAADRRNGAQVELGIVVAEHRLAREQDVAEELEARTE